ncbi:MAG: ribosome-associated translation inhibitor RaiA [Bacteroidota bacterium]
MDIQLTARRFHARSDLKARAVEAVRKLGKFYDGIVSADIILSYERGLNSLKTAEINLRVHGTLLSARQKSEDYMKSVDAAVEKLSVRLQKYKARLRQKDKTRVRALKARP